MCYRLLKICSYYFTRWGLISAPKCRVMRKGRHKYFYLKALLVDLDLFTKYNQLVSNVSKNMLDEILEGKEGLNFLEEEEKNSSQLTDHRNVDKIVPKIVGFVSLSFKFVTQKSFSNKQINTIKNWLNPYGVTLREVELKLLSDPNTMNDIRYHFENLQS